MLPVLGIQWSECAGSSRAIEFGCYAQVRSAPLDRAAQPPSIALGLSCSERRDNGAGLATRTNGGVRARVQAANVGGRVSIAD